MVSTVVGGSIPGFIRKKKLSKPPKSLSPWYLSVPAWSSCLGVPQWPTVNRKPNKPFPPSSVFGGSGFLFFGFFSPWCFVLLLLFSVVGVRFGHCFITERKLIHHCLIFSITSELGVLSMRDLYIVNI